MSSFHYHHHSKRGFTLAELFVSVLIVFVVGLLLFPVFAKPRHSRHRGSGASNQKQIALAFLQYLQDYDEQFPPAVGYVQVQVKVPMPSVLVNRFDIPQQQYRTVQVQQSWGVDRQLPGSAVIPGIIGPYVKSNQLFLDPAAARTEHSQRILEYMYNDLLVHQKQESIKDVKLTVLITDAENRLENAGHALTPNSGPYSAVFNSVGGCDAGQGASVRSARMRHSDGANFAFADGHVKWFKGGPVDPIFFPPRDSTSVSASDPQTRQQIGPEPGVHMTFGGRYYGGTFHVR